MKIRYPQKMDEKTAKATGYALTISRKQAFEIGNFIRGSSLQRAKAKLENVLNKKDAIPFKRHHGDVGHRKGNIAAGRYPQKASKEILSLIRSAESNARQKGLDESSLVLDHISVHKGPSQMRYGRQRGRSAKRTHVMVMLRELEKKKSKKSRTQTTKEEDKKQTIEPKKIETKIEKTETKVTEKKSAKKEETKKEETKKEEVKESPKQKQEQFPKKSSEKGTKTEEKKGGASS